MLEPSISGPQTIDPSAETGADRKQRELVGQCADIGFGLGFSEGLERVEVDPDQVLIGLV
jgi:hypothetical protein